MSISHHRPFRVDFSARGSRSGVLLRAAKPLIERALAFPTLNEIYAQIKSRPNDNRDFPDKVLDALHIRVRVLDDNLARIPTTGPVVVVANHPFGAIEGLVLYSILRRVRPDVKLLANYLLSAIPDLHDNLIFVDPFGGPGAARKNLASMRCAVDWVSQGGVLGVFPSGEVSHLTLRRRTIADPPWSSSIGRMIMRTEASVVPIFFYGRNSAFFQLSGIVHPQIRTTLLSRELLKKRRHTVRLRVGSTIPSNRIATFTDPQVLTNYLRVRTYILKSHDVREARARRAALVRETEHAAPIAAPEPVEAMVDEIALLPDDQRLMSHRDMDVLIAEADRIPTVLREIGRLREVTFRQVGEGTGSATDLDRFDQHYLHLLVWNRAKAHVVGAYRMGLTDRILPTLGVEGLYTSTLFRFKRRLLDQISPAIELGRSFVRPSDQRSFAPLMLLWCGVGRFIASHPRYRHLFGTVSISAEYSSMSKRLLMHFLQTHRALPQLAGLLKPRNPPRQRPSHDLDLAALSTVVNDVGGVNELLADLETDGKSMPVLLRQYLKLNGRLLGLNIDPDFGNVLDGLMLFDVLDIPRPLLNRYMGADRAAGFFAFHGRRE